MDRPTDQQARQQTTIDRLAIHDWVKGLAAIPARDFTLEKVQDYIVRMPCPPRNSRQILLFLQRQLHPQPDFQERIFECMTICWEIGQPAACTIIATRIAGCPCPSADCASRIIASTIATSHSAPAKSFPPTFTKWMPRIPLT